MIITPTDHGIILKAMFRLLCMCKNECFLKSQVNKQRFEEISSNCFQNRSMCVCVCV